MNIYVNLFFSILVVLVLITFKILNIKKNHNNYKGLFYRKSLVFNTFIYIIAIILSTYLFIINLKDHNVIISILNALSIAILFIPSSINTLYKTSFKDEEEFSHLKYVITEDYDAKIVRKLNRFGIGWHYDTAMHLMRFILSGIFDKLPNLKMIVGHWGELLPFYFDRMDEHLSTAVTELNNNIKYYFENNIYTNPSGIWSKNDFDFVLKTFPKEHILWAQDYCYGVNDIRVKTFLEEYPLDNDTKEMISYKNAERLFKIDNEKK